MHTAQQPHVSASAAIAPLHARRGVHQRHTNTDQTTLTNELDSIMMTHISVCMYTDHSSHIHLARNQHGISGGSGSWAEQ